MKEVEQRGYINVTHLAAGGEGNVFTCEKQGVKFLVKVIAVLEPEQLEILKSINALRNDFFPKIIEIFNTGENTIIIREYIEGTTLHDEIKKNEHFSYGRAKEIIFDVCSTLRALHSMKPHPIIYRDLKPENIIVTPDGKVKLIDFGIARYYKQESVRDTVLAGTKGYTAPEVMAGMQSDERSDIYSIGLLFYELLSGKSLQNPPYQIRPIAENNEYMPDYIDEIIAKATDINQTNRYATIDAFVYELENIKEIKAAEERKKKKRKVFAAISIIVVLAVAAILIAPLLFGEKVEMLLELNFDDEQDISYISGYQDTEGRFEVSDGVLNVVHDGCNLEYMPANGMLVHFRLKTSNPGGAIGLSQYRINPSLEFECIYYNEEQNVDMTTWNKKLSGMPIVNTGQWLDFILYTNETNSAVYAIICDNESRNIAYTAYQIPEFFDENTFEVVMMAFFDDNSNYMMIDYINIAEGSLRQYLNENIAAYAQHRSKVDAFLSQDVAALPEMAFAPPDSY
ncbi:MAG: serine/threonine-protein kinase [Eubacteriales bacterium]|nr:serine/threonine-protein kinase [Eubacteriales bacterium]